MTAAAVCPTGTIPAPPVRAVPARAAGRRRRRCPPPDLPRGRLPAGAAPAGPPRVAAARRAGRLGAGGRGGAHRDADPARRPHRARPAAPPRRRARRRLAGAAARRTRPTGRATVRAAVEDWTATCARIDHMLRDVATAARQWQVTGDRAARGTPSPGLPRPGRRRRRADRRGGGRPAAAAGRAPPPATGPPSPASSHCRLSGPRAAARAGPGAGGLLRGRPRPADRRASPSVRPAWRLHGRQDYRAAVVRLRGRRRRL